MNLKGRPKAEWQKNLLKLKNLKKKEISLSQLQKITNLNREYLSQSISRLVSKSRKETYYNTQEIYEAIKNKLQES